MRAILDSNLIYYWSGIAPSLFSIHKITTELAKYETVLVPSWIIIELLTTSNLTVQQKKHVFDFISAMKIQIIPTEPSHRIFLPPYPELVFASSNSLLVKRGKEFKIQAEVAILNVVLKTSILVLAEYVSSPSQKLHKEKLQINLTALIKGNHSFIDSEITRILLKFYSDDNEAKMKNDLQSLIYLFFYAFSINNNLSMNGKTLEEYMTKIGVDRDCVAEFQSGLSIDLFHKRIIQELNKQDGKKKVISDARRFNVALEVVERDMKELASPGILKYYLIFIKKILVDSTKLAKNDTIDSQLMFFFPSDLILTNDGRMKSIIGEIDKDYLKKIASFFNSVKV